MQLIQTAPGCKYSIVARVDTTIYSPDQTWTLDIPAGQHAFIAETNEIIIPGDAMICQKQHQTEEALARVNLLGEGAGSMATFIARAIEQIVGKGNAKVEYGEGKLTVSLVDSTIDAQFTAVDNLLNRLLPKDVVLELEGADASPVDVIPADYYRLEYLESTGNQCIDLGEATLDTIGMQVELETVGVPPSNVGFLSGVFTMGNRIYAVMIRCYKGIGYSYGTSTTYPLTTGDDVTKESAIGDKGYLPKGRFKVGCNWLNDRKWFLSSENVERTLTASLTPTRTRIGLFARYYEARRIFTDFERSRVFRAEVSQEEQKTHVLVPVLDHTGRPCMYDTVTEASLYNIAPLGIEFTAGMTIKQARNLANLPATGGSLTVSLPSEAEFDAAVQRALTAASSNGWTIITQYRTN